MAKTKSASVVAEPATAAKFLVSSSALLKALTPLAGVITHNPVVPSLSCFLLTLEAGQLTCTASDLEVTLSTRLPVDARQDLSVCLPARLVLDTLKGLPDQPLTIRVDLDTFTVQLRSVNGEYKLAGRDAREYPQVPDVQGAALELPSALLRRAIAKTQFAISHDELRPAMTGVLVERAFDYLRFVATDGHRLLRYTRTDAGTGERAGARAIVPRKAWQLLGKLLPPEAEAVVDTAFGQSQAAFRWDSFTLTSRLIDERYPEYENVIPVSNPNVLLINRAELLSAVRRLSVYANRTTHQLRLKLHGSELELLAEDLDFSNSASETFPCQYEGEQMQIGFNAKFLLELLSNQDTEEVSLALSTPSRAGVLTPVAGEAHEDVLMLVMPLTLNNYV